MDDLHQWYLQQIIYQLYSYENSEINRAIFLDTDYFLVVVSVVHTPFMQVVHTPFVHDVATEVDDEVEVDDGIGTDGPIISGIIGVITPQLGVLFGM